MPNLSCHRDATHQLFRGKRVTHTTSTIEVDAHANVVTSTFSSADYETHPYEYDVSCATCGAVVRRAQRDKIPFDPRPGMIVLCDFTGGFVPPEMVKMRPSVIVSRRDRTGKLTALVAPISTSRPFTMQPVYVPILKANYAFLYEDGWVKADTVTHVRYGRLKRLHDPTTNAILDPKDTKLSDADMKAVRGAVLIALGLGELTRNL